MSGASRTLAAAAAAPTHSWTGAAVMLAFGSVVVVTTEFIVVGLLPEMARDLRVSVSTAGWFVTWFAFASAVLGPPLTVFAGRFAPRAVLAATLVVFALGNLVAVLAPTYAVIVVVRIAQGATLPVLVSIGNASIAAMAGPGHEGRALGLVYLGVVIAIVVAVPGGIALADSTGWALSFALLAILAALGALILGWYFPRLDPAGATSLAAQAAILRNPLMQAHLLLSAAIFAAMFAGYSYLAAFLDSVAGFDGGHIAGTLVGFGLAGVLGNWIAARAVDRGPTVATAAGAAVLMVSMTAVSLVGDKLLLLLPLLALWGAAHTAAFLLCQVRVMLAAPAAPAFASSLNISACNLGIALGTAFGGWSVDQFGIGTIGLVGGALAACALVMALVVQRLPRNRGGTRCDVPQSRRKGQLCTALARRPRLSANDLPGKNKLLVYAFDPAEERSAMTRCGQAGCPRPAAFEGIAAAADCRRRRRTCATTCHWASTVEHAGRL